MMCENERPGRHLCLSNLQRSKLKAAVQPSRVSQDHVKILENCGSGWLKQHLTWLYDCTSDLTTALRMKTRPGDRPGAANTLRPIR